MGLTQVRGELGHGSPPAREERTDHHTTSGEEGPGRAGAGRGGPGRGWGSFVARAWFGRGERGQQNNYAARASTGRPSGATSGRSTATTQAEPSDSIRMMQADP